MKKVLITGGAGFIGSHLALKLLNKGYEVTIIDNLSIQVHGNNVEESQLYNSVKSHVHFIRGTVNSRNDLLKAIENSEVIIHLAAETGTGQSMYQIEKYSEVNILGTALLLDILVNTRNKVEKVLVASSRAIYGEGKYLSEEKGFVYPDHRLAEDMDKGDFEVKYPDCKSPLKVRATDEESRIHPSSVYGITKQTQEQMVLTVCKSINLPAVAFRYQNVYGPGQSLSNPYTGIISIFSTLIKNRKEINIFEDGQESRDFVYIDDVVDATIAGIENENANFEVFNVGTGIATNVLTVAETLIKHYGIDVPIRISGNYRIGDIRHNFADISKINKLLGFNPKISFDKGIGRFVSWVSTQSVQNDKYAQSISEMKDKGLFR